MMRIRFFALLAAAAAFVSEGSIAHVKADPKVVEVYLGH